MADVVTRNLHPWVHSSTIAIMAKASRRALTVLGLFPGHQPRWLVHRASFEMKTHTLLHGQRWNIGRSIAASDAGLWSSISMTPSHDLTPRQRKKVQTEVWGHLRHEMVSAGFEDRCDLSEQFVHAFFIRRVPSLKHVGGEWSFLKELPVNHVLRGGRLAHARKPTKVVLKDIEGRADRLFRVLRRNRELMSHLDMMAYVRVSREAVGDERWTGRLRLVGDPDGIQAVAQFYIDGFEDIPRQSRTYTRIRRAMEAQGYEAFRRIAFSKAPLGPVSVQREKAFLDTFSIRGVMS